MLADTRPTLPPKPKIEDLEANNWRLTGECRTPNKEKDETWCLVYECGIFSPWSSRTGMPSNHHVYGTKRWIIEPF